MFSFDECYCLPYVANCSLCFSTKVCSKLISSGFKLCLHLHCIMPVRHFGNKCEYHRALISTGLKITKPKLKNYRLRNGTLILKLPAPARHHNYFDGDCEQGFIARDGVFVSREEGLKLCRANGETFDLFGSVLTSEDLW